jgi:hypothetical protein
MNSFSVFQYDYSLNMNVNNIHIKKKGRKQSSYSCRAAVADPAVGDAAIATPS